MFVRKRYVIPLLLVVGFLSVIACATTTPDDAVSATDTHTPTSVPVTAPETAPSIPAPSPPVIDEVTPSSSEESSHAPKITPEPVAPVVAEVEPDSTPESNPAPPATDVKSDVQISYMFYDGEVPSSEADEYVEITNLGEGAQNLLNWVLRDISEGYPSFTFPSYVLEPGASIRVYTNEYHPEFGGFSFGYGKAVWNNADPDTAALYDSAGRLVSSSSY